VIALTEAQGRVLDVIVRLTHERGFPPTIREIGKGLGLTSTNAVSGHLDALARKGWITRDTRVARSIVVRTT